MSPTHPTPNTQSPISNLQSRIPNLQYPIPNPQSPKNLPHLLAMHGYSTFRFSLLYDRDRSHAALPDIAAMVDQTKLEIPETFEDFDRYVLQRIERIMQEWEPEPPAPSVHSADPR